MNRTLKLLVMFAPLVLFFAGFVILAQDLRHPSIETDQCTVMAVGSQVLPLRSQGLYLYKHSENVLHDLALQCDQRGLLLINDAQLGYTPVKTGQSADLSIKSYRYLPRRWLLGIHTGKPAQ